jgi:hypothetical protein
MGQVRSQAKGPERFRGIRDGGDMVGEFADVPLVCDGQYSLFK